MADRLHPHHQARRDGVELRTIMTAKHVRMAVRELGYSRSVCAECRVDWPCPVVAQARDGEADRLRDLRDLRELERALSEERIPPEDQDAACERVDFLRDLLGDNPNTTEPDELPPGY